jgi:cytochrome P450
MVTLNDQYLAENSLLPLIVGSGHNDPYPVYDYLRAHHPVFRDKSGLWLISTHKLVKQIFENREGVFYIGATDERLACLKDTVLIKQDEDHARLRKLLAPLFSPDALARLSEFIDAKAKRQIAPLRQMARFEISKIAFDLAISTICKLLGIPQNEAMGYFIAAQGMAKIISSPCGLDDDERAKLLAEAKRFNSMLETLVKASGTGSEGAVGHFLRLEETGEMTRDETLGNLMLLFVLGYITSALSMGNVVEAALRNRHIWESWCADPSLIPDGAREIIRYESPLHGIGRLAKRDVELDGQTIRAGECVLLLMASANRDPLEFSSPDEIDLKRTEGRHATFGMGAHTCIGRILSKMEVDSFVATLVENVPAAILDRAASQRTQLGRVQGYPALWLTNPAAGKPA